MKIKAIKGVKRIVIPEQAEAAALPAGVYVVKSGKRKRKKLSKSTRLFEKIARRAARVQLAIAENYLERHERSNRKKRDGWARDLGYNLLRAQEKGAKQFKLSSLL